MWKNMSIFLTTLCLISVDISSALLQSQAFAQPRAQAFAQSKVQSSTNSQAQVFAGVPNPIINQDPVVKSLGDCISNNLQSSQVLAPYNQFTVDNPSDLIFRAGTTFLTTAGIWDPRLAQLNADAAKKAAPLTSKLFFDAVGFAIANFFASRGLVTPANVDNICLKFVSSIELEARAHRPTDTLTMMTSVTSGTFNVLRQYGLTDYLSMKTLFNLFSQVLTSQAFAQSQAQAFAQAQALAQPRAQVSAGVPNPVFNQDPSVKSLADCISNNLRSSQVLAPYNQFTVDNPSDLIFRAGTTFLTTAGIWDPRLAQLVADAAKKAAPLTSKLFFDAVGFTIANFFASRGLVTPANVDNICLQFVSSIELEAYAHRPTDTLTMINSVTSGIFKVFGQYGLTDYQSFNTLFNLFSQVLSSLTMLNKS